MSVGQGIVPPELAISSVASQIIPYVSLAVTHSSFDDTFGEISLPTFISPVVTANAPFLVTLPALGSYAGQRVAYSVPSTEERDSRQSTGSDSS